MEAAPLPHTSISSRRERASARWDAWRTWQSCLVVAGASGSLANLTGMEGHYEAQTGCQGPEKEEGNSSCAPSGSCRTLLGGLAIIGPARHHEACKPRSGGLGAGRRRSFGCLEFFEKISQATLPALSEVDAPVADPLPGRWKRSSLNGRILSSSRHPAFCCFACEIAARGGP